MNMYLELTGFQVLLLRRESGFFSTTKIKRTSISFNMKCMT